MLITEKIKTSKIKSNPDNPRIIKDERFKGLVQSIKEFPEMLELRPIVVDKDLMVLGGNMRLKACKELNLKDVYITKADNLTEEQKKEFIIKDNASFGEWDYSQLSEWDNEQLEEWGLDLWQNEDDIETSDSFNLPEGDKNNLEQITYTLSSEQSNIIKEAIEDIKHTEEYNYIETYGNENSNGNALYLLITQWGEQRK
jgi:predicted DNA-binding protein